MGVLMSTEKLKILAVDISHVFRRNWEAAEGKEMGEAYRRTVEAVMRFREGLDRVAVCCDGGPSFRKVIDRAYKANRSDPGPAYREQLQRTIERLRADGCSVFAAPRMPPDGDVPSPWFYEADDVIGSLCAWAGPLGHGVRVLSGDKDLLQLVTAGRDGLGVDVQRPDDGKILDAPAVLEKLGVEPAHVPDWLALAGDNGDGFKPFPGPAGEGGRRKPGIGDKTAIEIIKAALAWDPEGDTRPALRLFAMLEIDETNPDSEPILKIGPAVRAILKEHGIAAAQRGLDLATIRRDLSLDFSVLLAPVVITPIAEPKSYAAPAATQERQPTPLPPSPKPVEPTSALVRLDLDPLALQPRDLDQLQGLALCAFNARCYGQFGNVEGIMMCVLEARERGIPMGAALRNAYVVKGKLAWSTQMMVGLILTSGLADVFEIVETTSTQAIVAYQRKGRAAGKFTFTLEEAKTAGWLKSGERGDGKWLTNPRTMLRWAAFRECARFVWPDVVAGMYSPDELRNGQITDAEYEVESEAGL
jgi:5'-3' exonuclease